MARINLLPWREAERKKRQQEFGFMVLAGIALTGLAVFGIHMMFESQITAQNQRNGYLEKEISMVESQIREIEELDKTKQNLLARMNVIQELQSSRPQIVHLFDEIVTALPDGVYLNVVSQKGSKVAFEGRAQSNARVSSMMRNIDDSEWIGNPQLDFIESKEKTGTGYSHFKLTASQITQAGEEKK
ncbi:MAG: PilN domain-containing protein [Candidatus Thiodiazotropha sp. (ex Semelilucina semeliformis)]|nr:PilN domain-containing protein [Candidatus Thiodiazotropha sp. (ex Myrtea spinifera)]MCU7806800.1 PilN domain-containing protein [Candidatus Thiodiazotropha sp. (ex Semelilucina semeliformis)]MCU7828513.1 PilN domain-containing protein [Candidatus Thiodiazotropha sp. (ex Myrtea sp. 'scaly one' KF741663)]